MNFYAKHDFHYSHTIKNFYHFEDKDHPANCYYKILPYSEKKEEPDKFSFFNYVLKSLGRSSD
ncbi:hypothetical protein HZS_333 [Henneguya salminicola]|nr:hypothetical protein HZS_333 [Henneguya salminicola]